MDIKAIKWKDHPILGSLGLNFSNGTQPFKNILFAGENGTGKTSILASINGFLTGDAMVDIEYIDYTIGSDNYRAKATSSVGGVPIPGSYEVVNANGQTETMSSHGIPNGVFVNKQNDARYYGSVFSKARADYKTDAIMNVTSRTLDDKKHDRDEEENFTTLKQLLVDIDSQDNEEFTRQSRDSSSPILYSNWFPNSKVYRFKIAFEGFFENMKYSGANQVANQKQIIFKKYGNDITIDQLSTGEKQVVFRGSYLLRYSTNLTNGTVFVDEPELSMHPKWQRKILKFYTALFTVAQIQTTQMFFATHSEHVLKEALEDDVNSLVITLTTDSSGVIKAKKIDAPKVLPTITHAETNYLAFDMVTNDYHIELYGYLQHKANLTKVKETDTFIINNSAYNSVTHEKISSFETRTYNSISTYIRNCIDHPDPTKSFSEDELRKSIELMIVIISNIA